MFCIHCGKRIDNSVKICPYCGKKTENVAATDNTKKGAVSHSDMNSGISNGKAFKGFMKAGDIDEKKADSIPKSAFNVDERLTIKSQVGNGIY